MNSNSFEHDHPDQTVDYDYSGRMLLRRSYRSRRRSSTCYETPHCSGDTPYVMNCRCISAAKFYTTIFGIIAFVLLIIFLGLYQRYKRQKARRLATLSPNNVMTMNPGADSDFSRETNKEIKSIYNNQNQVKMESYNQQQYYQQQYPQQPVYQQQYPQQTQFPQQQWQLRPNQADTQYDPNTSMNSSYMPFYGGQNKAQVDDFQTVRIK